VTPVPDGKYGSRTPEGWDGMIGELKYNVCQSLIWCETVRLYDCAQAVNFL